MKRIKVANGLKHPPFQAVPLKVTRSTNSSANIYEAVEGCLAVDVRGIPLTERDKVMEIAV
jgi:hypothetical protein